MIGIDTNILVRFLTKDDQKQFRKTYQLFSQRNTTYLISYPTLVELIWVLEKRYSFGKQQLILILEELTKTKNFRFSDQLIVEKAIKVYKESSADFSDCLIGVLNEAQGCTTTYTFDKEASKLAHYSSLE